MEFNLKEWRHEEEKESSAKYSIPLSVPDSSHNNSCATKMGSYFSLAQWQDLELQALIFRHIIAGAAVPPHLLHLLNKSIITSPYNYQPSLVQSGYWGKGSMDPEPGRCRRTDGKKWRCSRDVVSAQKYCERHMHRGRNRSRKPVEIPTSQRNSTALAGGPAAPQFSLSGPLASSTDLHLNRRPLESINETKCTFESHNDARTDSGGRTLRRFFDDWPRSDNATNLSISTPGSDFSLKLGSGDGDGSKGSGERDRPQLNWGMAWENNRVAPMGGPLAEALRSSASSSSPTSVLHRLARSSASENSYVSS